MGFKYTPPLTRPVSYYPTTFAGLRAQQQATRTLVRLAERRGEKLRDIVYQLADPSINLGIYEDRERYFKILQEHRRKTFGNRLTRRTKRD